MPPFKPRRPTFLSLALVTVALLAGCDDCLDQPCGPRVTMRLNLPPEAADTRPTVVACQVDVCETTTLPVAAAPGSSADLSFQRADVDGSLVTRADGSLQLVVKWTVGMTGDRFRVDVTAAPGVELAALDAPVTFPVASLKSGACLPCSSVTLGDPA